MNFKEYSIDEKSAYLLKQIDQIKSIFSGRDNFYLPYTHNGLHYSEEKADNFCNKLMEILAAWIQETNQDVPKNWRTFYISFFKLAILFCDLMCNEDDWIFESFIKLSKAVQKDEELGSPLDILVCDLNNEYENNDTHKNQVSVINHYYQCLHDLYDTCHSEWFEQNVRYSINTFLDRNGLSLFVDDDKFNSAVNTLNMDIRRLKRIKQKYGEINHE